MKKLKRSIIIRQSDFLALQKKALSKKQVYYNSAEFDPITKKNIEIDRIMKTLSGKKVEYRFQLPYQYLIAHEQYLYNKIYIGWQSWYDSDGEMLVRSKSDQPPEPLGWAHFEKNLEC